MRKILLLLSFMILSTLTVFAEDQAVPTPRPTFRPRQELREERQNVREEAAELRSSVAAQHASRLSKHFTFYATRFNNIITRFEARLEQVRQAGQNVDNVKTKLAAASTKLSQAQKLGEEAVAAFQALGDTSPRANQAKFIAARQLAVSARQAFLETNVLLKAALKELKTVSKPALPAASAAVNNGGSL